MSNNYSQAPQCCLHSKGSSPHRRASIRTFLKPQWAACQYGFRKSDGRCNLNADLTVATSFSAWRRSAHYTQSPELGESPQNSRSLHAATVLLWLRTCRGSYTSPVAHNLSRSTASFRAIATSARFLAFLPPAQQTPIPNAVDRCLVQRDPECG